jgi:hypothetical protein
VGRRGRNGKVCSYNFNNEKLMKDFRNDCGINRIKRSTDSKNIIIGDFNGKNLCNLY